MACISADPAAASDLTWKGRTVTVTIGFSTGGNYDFVGRLVARHILKHMAGAPTGIAVNMPGAGSIRAANYIFNSAPRDGTALGILSSSIAIEEALGNPSIQYKSAEFGWIGRVSMILQVLATLDPARAKAIEDVRRIETAMGATGAGSPSEGYPRLMNGLLGTKFKIVSGYSSSADTMLAMERGEIDASLPSWNTIKRTKAQWLAEKKIHPLVQFVFERSPDLPDTPTSVELGRTPDERAVLEFYTSGEELGRSILAPPGLDPERLAAMRAAFMQMLKDDEFLAEVKKTQLEFNPLEGMKLQRIAANTVNASRETIERTRALLGAK
ncbi:MAG: Bug family tripartite tricarboxylate transporter substrate binding protein [Beijerinckiaceae bacterium]